MDRRDERELREPQPPLADIVDGAVRRVANAVAIAGALIALAIYARPGPPTYQAFWTGSSVVRVNTRSGWIIECMEGRCGTVVRPGRRLESRPPVKALPAPAARPAPPAQVAPAPAPAPKAPPAGNEQ